MPSRRRANSVGTAPRPAIDAGSGVSRDGSSCYNRGMTKLEQIQSSIETLSAEDLATLRDWLEDLDARLFDEKIERDAKAGKLDGLAQKARENLRLRRGEDF